jgi:5-hydroxyisourate hydrolase-like protein (transthyretin family)
MKPALPILAAIVAVTALPLSAYAADTDAGKPAAPRAAGAEGRPGDQSSMFQQLDANKDGVIDTGEANRSSQVKGDFKSLDANGDGKISADEWGSKSK